MPLRHVLLRTDMSVTLDVSNVRAWLKLVAPENIDCDHKPMDGHCAQARVRACL